MPGGAGRPQGRHGVSWRLSKQPQAASTDRGSPGAASRPSLLFDVVSQGFAQVLLGRLQLTHKGRHCAHASARPPARTPAGHPQPKSQPAPGSGRGRGQGWPRPLGAQKKCVWFPDPPTCWRKYGDQSAACSALLSPPLSDHVTGAAPGSRSRAQLQRPLQGWSVPVSPTSSEFLPPPSLGAGCLWAGFVVICCFRPTPERVVGSQQISVK